MINRSILVVRPKEPFLNWVNSLDASDHLNIAELTEEVTVFLLPEMDLPKLDSYLKRHFKLIFERELDGWHQDPRDWPRNITYKMFQEWFDVEWGSEVVDMGSDEILREIWD